MGYCVPVKYFLRAAVMVLSAYGVTQSGVAAPQETAGADSVVGRPRPEFDAKGFPVGTFRLFSNLDLTTGYDDNVFRQHAAQSDFLLTVAPQVYLRSDWGRHFAELYGGATYYNYFKFSDQNLADWKVGGDGRYDFGDQLAVKANGSFGELHESWSSPNSQIGFQAAPNQYYQPHGDVSVAGQLNRVGYSAGGSIDRYDWSGTSLVGGGVLDNHDRNMTEFQLFGRVSYDLMPGYSAYVRGTYDERKFDDFLDRSGAHRDSSGYRLGAGVSLGLTRLVSGDLFVGYIDQKYAAPLKSLSGLDYSAALNWYVSPVLTAHLSGGRTLNDVILAKSSAADNKSVSISADYEFRRNVIVHGGLNYTQTRYLGSTRTDAYPGATIGIKYLLNRYLSLDLDYNYSARSSLNKDLSYTDNIVSVALTFHP